MMNSIAFGDAIQNLTRPLVTLMLAGVLSWGFLNDKVSGDAFLSVVAIIVTFWFKDRESVRDAAATKAADTIISRMQEGAKS